MSRRSVLTVLACAFIVCGCGERRDRTGDESAFPSQSDDAVAVVVLDLSGSFEELLLGRDNRAFQFITQLIQELFHQSIGHSQRLVVAQISGTDKALLFDGTVMEFNRRFPDPGSFKEHLKAARHTAGSRVFDSISDALVYTLGLPTVEKGRTKVGLFVLSDFECNVYTDRSLPRLEEQLKLLATEYRGVIGCYYVGQQFYPGVVSLVQRCGFPRERGVVTSDVTASPPIPRLLK